VTPGPRTRSALHEPRLAALLGLALGATFTVCFLTGVWSHLAQHPPGWFQWPSRPAGLYRVTQGVHVATGLASIPLLLAKLWVVHPKLFERPAVRDTAHAVERLALVPLVGGGLFLLFTGLANINLWYPWNFNFPAAHHWMAWITIGALVVHVGAKATLVRSQLGRRSRAAPTAASAAQRTARRSFLGATAATSALVTLFTVGQTVEPLQRLALLAPRRPDTGPQGFPVNRTARTAGVVDAATSPGYRLRVTGRVERQLTLSLDELRALPQREAELPIACVEGWSASRRWRGVPVRDLLALAGAADGASVRVRSLQQRRSYRTSDLNPGEAADRDTLLALEVEGEPLHLDHGFPVRLIGPNRPGVLQTKWVTTLDVR
jgi:DMSO/TMAO reductase YedYZ molybdopterin-dependent catalytic subunit